MMPNGAVSLREYEMNIPDYIRQLYAIKQNLDSRTMLSPEDGKALYSEVGKHINLGLIANDPEFEQFSLNIALTIGTTVYLKQCAWIIHDNFNKNTSSYSLDDFIDCSTVSFPDVLDIDFSIMNNMRIYLSEMKKLFNDSSKAVTGYYQKSTSTILVNIPSRIDLADFDNLRSNVEVLYVLLHEAGHHIQHVSNRLLTLDVLDRNVLIRDINQNDDEVDACAFSLYCLYKLGHTKDSVCSLFNDSSSYIDFIKFNWDYVVGMISARG